MKRDAVDPISPSMRADPPADAAVAADRHGKHAAER
jgi:hypothetical protein